MAPFLFVQKSIRGAEKNGIIPVSVSYTHLTLPTT